MPKSVDDLDSHRIVTFGQAPSYLTSINWLETAGRVDGDIRRPFLRVNNAYGLRRVVEAGVGIASLADYIVGNNSSLVQVNLPGRDAAVRHLLRLS